ncbi:DETOXIFICATION 43-like protein [Tanacetum coccineum]
MTKDSGDSSKKEISTTSTPQFQCPMLKPSNYSLWAIRMQIILEANGLWEMIEPNEKTQADNKKDKTAIAFLYQALPEEQLLQITKHKTAKAIWDALKTRHIGEERVQQARLQTLKSDFEMLHMKEDETIDTFTGKLTTLVNKAASLGHTIEDSVVVRKLLNAVPDKFLQIVASIEQYSDLDEMSVDEAIGRLKTFEERLKYKNERPVNTQEGLLFTRHEDQGQQFRRRGHGGFNQSRGQENNKFRSERKNWESSQNNFKKETDSNSNKFTHDKSKVLCFKCKEIYDRSQDDVQLENLENGSKIRDEKKESAPEAGFKTSPCKHLTITETTRKKFKLKREKRNIPSASTALLFGAVLGLLETILLVFLAEPLLSLMGVRHGNKMLLPAHKYLTLRALGAPAVLLSLSMQGVFRGFKDTKTPLYATVAGDLANIILDPILIFVCKLGVSGAAIAHVLSQYLIAIILLVKLMQQVDLLPPSMKALQFSRFLKNGFLLLFKVLAATSCVTLAASLATRLGPTPMAAFQVCLQIWLTSSLLADGLAVAGQAIIATSFAEKNYEKATAAAVRVLQMGCVMGLGLALLVGLGLQFGSGVFTKDINVKHIITIGIPFVAGTQPINSIAFIFDGVNFGASDFAYSAYSMILVAIGSIGSLLVLYKAAGFIGIWIALSIFMGLRAIAGIWRMGTGTGPWSFLRKDSEKEESLRTTDKHPTSDLYKMSQPANDEFSQHLGDEESNHEDASDTGAAPNSEEGGV